MTRPKVSRDCHHSPIQFFLRVRHELCDSIVKQKGKLLFEGCRVREDIRFAEVRNPFDSNFALLRVVMVL